MLRTLLAALAYLDGGFVGGAGGRYAAALASAPLGVSLVSQREFRLAPAEESAATFLENALLKSRHLAQVSDLPTLADDSGLLVEALDGASGCAFGALCRRPSHGCAENDLLLARLQELAEEQRGAFFHCSLVWLRHAHDAAPPGRPGQLVRPHPAVSPGRRQIYGPLFLPHGASCSAAQLSGADKARHSHRGQALRALLAALGSLTGDS